MPSRQKDDGNRQELRRSVLSWLCPSLSQDGIGTEHALVLPSINCNVNGTLDNNRDSHGTQTEGTASSGSLMQTSNFGHESESTHTCVRSRQTQEVEDEHSPREPSKSCSVQVRPPVQFDVELQGVR